MKGQESRGPETTPGRGSTIDPTEATMAMIATTSRRFARTMDHDFGRTNRLQGRTKEGFGLMRPTGTGNEPKRRQSPVDRRGR